MPESEESTPQYLFGDLLALARQDWVEQMADRLSELGYRDYRRTDALAMRTLARRPRTISELGVAFGVSRQAARKIVDGLRVHGFVAESRDEVDGRRVNVALTESGRDYATAVVEVIATLNRELTDRVPPELLKAADTVLRVSIRNPALRQRADRFVAMPSGSPAVRRSD